MKRFNFIGNKKGAVLPLVALSIFVLIGFAVLVIDVGVIYAERRTMVTAADAAALAGARIMSDALGASDMEVAKTQAKTVAEDIAIKNGVNNIGNVKVIWDNDDYTRDTITVTLSNKKDSFFAKIFGFTSTDVPARAVATWGYITKIKGGDIIPLFVTDKDFEKYGEDEKVYLHSNQILTGNWGLLDVGSGGNGVRDGFGGEQVNVDFGIGKNVTIDSNPGGKQGPVKQGIEIRMQKANNLDSEEDRRRFMMGLVPVLDLEVFEKEYKQNGKTTLPIKYFAVFEILDIIIDEGNINTGNPSNSTPSVGSSIALYDNSNYKDDSDGGTKYWDIIDGKFLPKGSVIGRFTNELVDVDAIVVQPGDQTIPDDPKLTPAKYQPLLIE